MIESKPQFLQGIFKFSGQGYSTPVPVSEKLDYTVPGTKRAQLIYFRGGNSTGDMIDVILLRDGQVMRHFPIAAHGATHVPLALVEDLEPEQKLTLQVAAPFQCAGELVVDLGLVEI